MRKLPSDLPSNMKFLPGLKRAREAASMEVPPIYSGDDGRRWKLLQGFLQAGIDLIDAFLEDSKKYPWCADDLTASIADVWRSIRPIADALLLHDTPVVVIVNERELMN